MYQWVLYWGGTEGGGGGRGRAPSGYAPTKSTTLLFTLLSQSTQCLSHEIKQLQPLCIIESKHNKSFKLIFKGPVLFWVKRIGQEAKSPFCKDSAWLNSLQKQTPHFLRERNEASAFGGYWLNHQQFFNKRRPVREARINWSFFLPNC